MAQVIGTSHFVTRKSAVRYYKSYGLNEADVDQKLASGEIHIGQPSVGRKQVIVIDNGTRWAHR